MCDELGFAPHPDLTVMDIQLHFPCAEVFSSKPQASDISSPDTSLRVSTTWGHFLRWLQSSDHTDKNHHLNIIQYSEHMWFPLIVPIWLLQPFLQNRRTQGGSGEADIFFLDFDIWTFLDVIFLSHQSHLLKDGNKIESKYKSLPWLSWPAKGPLGEAGF